MSVLVDTHALAYREFVVSFANALTKEEVYQVAYIWLKGTEDISRYEPTRNPSVCGLELLAKLECLRVFSGKDINGLVEIAKKINRYDLVEKVEEHKRKKGGSQGIRYTKKNVRSEERQQFENTFTVMVTQMTFLEQQLSLLESTLQNKDECGLLDEGMEIVRHSSAIVQDLASNLDTVHKKLAHRSRADSTASGSSDGSKRNSGEMESLAVPSPLTSQTSSPTPQVSPLPVQQTAVQGKVVKPTPKPRAQKPQTPPPYKRPIQESSQHMSQVLRSPMATTDECNYDKQRKSHGKPPPVPPKRHSPRSNARHSGVAQLRRPRSAEYVTISEREEEEDGTGDSGRGTGSGTAKYGDIQDWRDAMENPPPETPYHRYQPIRRETMDEDLSYQELDYDR